MDKDPVVSVGDISSSHQMIFAQNAEVKEALDSEGIAYKEKDYSEVISVQRELGSKALVEMSETAPEGWKLPGNLVKDLGVSYKAIYDVVPTYRAEHPEWFAIYKNKAGKSIEHYHPDLVAYIHQELGSRSAAPDDWVTNNGLANELETTHRAVQNFASEFRATYPEWFVKYKTPKGAFVEHYHPVLVAKIREQFTGRVSLPPEGWTAVNGLVTELKAARETLQEIADSYRDSHPEWYKKYYPRGQMVEYYHPELVELIRMKRQESFPPEGWMTNRGVATELDTSRPVIQAIADRFREIHPEWFKVYLDSSGKEREHYAPELVGVLKSEMRKREDAPEGWMTNNATARLLQVDPSTIQRQAMELLGNHPEWSREYKNSQGSFVEHYHPHLIEQIRGELGKYGPISNGWISAKKLAQQLGAEPPTVKAIADRLRGMSPEGFMIGRLESGHLAEAFSPEVASFITQEYTKIEEKPEGWMTCSGLAKMLGAKFNVIQNITQTFRDTHPEWFKQYKSATGTVREHYAPELIMRIMGDIEKAKEHHIETMNQKGEQELLQKDIQDLLIDLEKGESLQAQEFKSLVSLFGAERAVDILYQRHPEYKKLPVPYVKSALADYLGEFLLVKGGFSLDSLEKGAPFLANTSFKDGLTEVIKNDCLRLLNELSRTSPDEVNEIAVAEYIEHIRQETSEFSSPDLEEVLGEIEAYYQLLFENIHKPYCFVDQLDDGRPFPDINQRINVQEIAFKHKILIADEMGMGKSASAIMAKEIIGAKQALVAVPSNVTSVWGNYLSDRVGEDGRQIGYFKVGQAPRVLMVNSLEDLTDISREDYDYIVISQERLNEKYTDALSEFNYDMLIVDEMHKLKNISSGKRSENLIRLAEQIEGEDKYLALLSGTPVPNKIGDVALTLKLLYPERFSDVDNKQLVSQILNGDMLDLRSLLVPRMQMKSLAENVDMPEFREVTRVIELSDREKEIYNILIEEDELSASEKLAALRQFAMNPRMLDATPDIVGSKPLKVGEALRSTFTQKDKVVMFVNGYIEGVMRGDDTIVQDLNLPQDVEVLTIDGSVSKERRIEIQNQLQLADEKILLIVSGQTADTGVDFSAAEAVYHYSEPWSIYDKQQQTARVYRPGLKSDLIVETFVAEGTIEHGIHEYIGSKYQAVEKLLRGVPISEIEKGMLRQAEKQADPNIEVNPELAKYYFSSWDKMMKIYGHVKEVGEEDFRKFLARYDKDYADSYADLVGSRSYQANVGRLSGSLIQEMIQERGQQAATVRVLDIASGPEVLRRHTVDELAQNVISVDINRQHFNDPQGKKAVGSMVHLPIADKSIDYTNLSLALHYTSFAPSKNNYERLEVLKEVNRVLAVGGRATISMIYSLSLNDDPVFEETMSKLGLKVISEYTGDVSGGKNFQTQVITLEKTRDCSSDVRTLAKEIGPQGIKALKFRKTDISLRNSKKVIKSFSLGERTIEARLNDIDQRVLAEEERVTTEMEKLKRQFGNIEGIPKGEIYRSGFSRIFNGKRYILFKRLDVDAGTVVIR